MPKIIIHARSGIFDAGSRQAIAGELTDLALDCEMLPQSPFVRSTVWTYFVPCPADAVFMGDQQAYRDIVSVQIFTIDGGLDSVSKPRLIAGVTDILRQRMGEPEPAPIFIVVHEIPEASWGIFGRSPDLRALRASDPKASAL